VSLCLPLFPSISPLLQDVKDVRESPEAPTDIQTWREHTTAEQNHLSEFVVFVTQQWLTHLYSLFLMGGGDLGIRFLCLFVLKIRRKQRQRFLKECQNV
jgi:hypothetical protein